VVADGGVGQVDARGAVHEGGRAEGGFPGQAEIDEERPPAADRDPEGGGQLHEGIVGVLAVDEVGAAVRSLARLQQQGVALGAQRRLEGHHRAQPETGGADRARAHAIAMFVK
jgi:hypothetical protein